MGGTSNSKSYDPFQETSDYKKLPVTPGLVEVENLRILGQNISLQSLQGDVLRHTQNLYQVREIQNLRFCTRTLMYSRGRIQNLSTTESSPPNEVDTLVERTGSLIIGAGDMYPAVKNKDYVGLNSIEILNSAAIFPFGVTVPGFIWKNQGKNGHLFQASGGTAPYQWTIRTTMSSSRSPAEPVKLPDTEGEPPYPFDSIGNLKSNRSFPQAVWKGGIPPGMILNRDGLLYGTPTESGTYLFRLVVKDSSGKWGEATVRLVVLETLNSKVPCKTDSPSLFTTTIVKSQLTPINSFSETSGYKREFLAVGGSGNYSWRFLDPLDNPKQSIPNIGGIPNILINGTNGTVSLLNITETSYDQLKGIWLS